MEYNGKLYRIRCQNQFSVRLDQCCKHPKTVFKDGPNRVLSMLDRGDEVTWGIIKDPANLAPLQDTLANENPALANGQIPATSTIWSSWRGASSSAPGILVFDAKAKENPNGKRTKRWRMLRHIHRMVKRSGELARRRVLLQGINYPRNPSFVDCNV